MKNEFVTYVLYSIKYDKIYIGYTSNLIERFKSHNYLSNKGYTLKYRPWLVVSVDFFESKKDALNREKSLKAGKGREEIRQQIITNPIISKFLSGSYQP